MATAVEWLLGNPLLGNLPYRPKLILSAGYAGALQDNYRVGDIVLATEVADLDGKRWPATWPEALPGGEWRPPLRRGRVLTVPRLVGTAAEKRALGVKHDSVAVDMESAAVARLCDQQSVPFGCLRAVSDDSQTDLSPQLITLCAGGRVAPWRLLTTLARRPRLVREVWQLARHTRQASQQLAIALGELLTLTLPWAEDL
jgi:adenosylhomocysteine nucleosidase